MLRILLTNDDGITADGLQALRRSLGRIGEVAIIAPDHNWSSAGHNKTMHRPLRVTEVDLQDGGKGFASDGSPSDCVALGLLGLLAHKPDLVVSGINSGPNLGDDVTYSGTVAAAMEAVISGIPGIAVSLGDYFEWDFTYAADFTASLVEGMMQRGLAGATLLNVNIPNVARERIAGVEITRLGKRIYRDALIERKDPFGRSYYWIGGEVPTGESEEGTDLKAVAENKISITPIHLDLTNHALIDALRRWNLRP